jgi:hypothetical protein
MQDVQGRLAHLEAELGRTASQNKLLSATLQQRDRELSALRQQKAALERAAAQQAGGGGPMHRSLSLSELQKQLESAQRQLAFKESEVGAAGQLHARTTSACVKGGDAGLTVGAARCDTPPMPLFCWPAGSARRWMTCGGSTPTARSACARRRPARRSCGSS